MFINLGRETDDLKSIIQENICSCSTLKMIIKREIKHTLKTTTKLCRREESSLRFQLCSRTGKGEISEWKKEGRDSKEPS